MIGLWPAVALTQGRFDLYMFVMDDRGLPVTDLKATDIVVREDTSLGEVIDATRFSWPIKVTVLVDNGGPDADDRLVHYRNSLKRFFDALPPDVEVSLIALSPNPRWLVRSTTDPVQIEKGVNLVTPDVESYGRFSDALIEYAARLDEDFGPSWTGEHLPPYLATLVCVCSAGFDSSQPRLEPLKKMLTSLRNYRVWTNFIMLAPSGTTERYKDVGSVTIAKSAQELTGGRYDALAGAATSRLASLLPEIARQIAARHTRQTNQYRVTMERPGTATGPLKNLAFSVARNGVRYVVTPDGNLP